MTWIATIPPEQATGPLAALYRAIESARGGVAVVHQAQSLNPRALRAHLDLYRAVVFQDSTLPRRLREAVAVVVSATNRCAYCVAHHGEALARLGEPAAVVDALSRGDVPDDLPTGDRLLLAWARRGAERPAEATAADLEALRDAGFDDRAILDATLTVAYFSFVNRLVLLLGARLEPDYARTCGDDPGEQGGAEDC